MLCVLQVGKQHELSAGLLIGGKDVKEEKGALSQMNILVATPGENRDLAGRCTAWALLSQVRSGARLVGWH